MRIQPLFLIVTVNLISGIAGLAAVIYVDANSSNPMAPYTNWSTAATSIQDAVDAASSGDEVLVTNGIYQTGARVATDGIMSRVVVTNQLAVQSVNGFGVTVIDGGHAGRCVYLANSAVLSGFTLSDGSFGAGTSGGGGVRCESFSNEVVASCLIISNSAPAGGGVNQGTVSNCIIAWNNSQFTSGGGAESCALSNCVLSNNTAALFGGAASGGISSLNNCVILGNSSMNGGGGVYGSTLNNCLIISNRCTTAPGGGAYDCILNNCTVAGNSAPTGGGVATSGTFVGIFPATRNCIVYYNSANVGTNFSIASWTNCCTTPLPSGPGNITNAPLFVNFGLGDLHLQSNSPCINAGNNAYVTTSTDRDGNPRVVGGTVDIGAYEFQQPTSVISYAWLQQFGLPTDGSADFIDSDGDGMNNWQEWICGTVPTNAASVLKMLPPRPGLTGVAVPWLSVTNRSYFVERAGDLAAPFMTLATNIPGRLGTTTFTDTNAVGPFFYRVGVHQ